MVLVNSGTNRIYSFDGFRYDVVLPKHVLDRVVDDKASICKAIMETAQFSPEIWRIGKTKVFMKESDMVSGKRVIARVSKSLKIADR